MRNNNNDDQVQPHKFLYPRIGNTGTAHRPFHMAQNTVGSAALGLTILELLILYENCLKFIYMQQEQF
jgi:hypothetical protein